MAEGPSKWRNICCNPFDKAKHRVTKKSHLRTVTKWMCEKAPSISQGQRICDVCRQKLAKTSMPKPPEPSETWSEPASSESDHAGISSSDHAGISSSPIEEALQVEKTGESLALVNQCLETIGETPITKRKLQFKKNPRRKLRGLLQ